MPSNKSTTYHQSVQFFGQFFSKKIVFLLIKKIFFFKNIFLKKFYYSVLPQIYSVLPHFTQFYLVWYSVLPNTRSSPGGGCFSGGSRESLLAHGCCARAVQKRPLGHGCDSCLWLYLCKGEGGIAWPDQKGVPFLSGFKKYLKNKLL